MDSKPSDSTRANKRTGSRYNVTRPDRAQRRQQSSLENILRERLEKARERIGWARATAETCATALSHEPEDGETTATTLRALAALLDHVAGILDPSNLLNSTLTDDETYLQTALEEARCAAVLQDDRPGDGA